ncbi:MAG: GNAT family N-acetyltransferase [Clostridiales bacterium]|nr:GNAT family N-acetyltransferase [Clostridiales bacterium]
MENVDLNRISALALEDNIASWRLMEKVGMKYEGILRQYAIKNGIPMDLKGYSILKDER